MAYKLQKCLLSQGANTMKKKGEFSGDKVTKFQHSYGSISLFVKGYYIIFRNAIHN